MWNVQIVVFCIMMLYGLVNGYWHLGGEFSPKDGSSMFLRHISIHLQEDYMMSQLHSEESHLLNPQNLYYL
jgi:hypothetical protein